MKVTIAEAKKQIKNAVRTYLYKGEDGQYMMPALGRLPLYMVGSPGIGKTEIANSVAEEMEIGFVSFSLTHHTRNSLLGLPVIKELDDGRRYTEFTMSEVLAAVEKSYKAGHEEGILLLDEFNSISETIMPAMLAFLQTKNIGEFYLPEGWIIVLAGNPSEYNRSAKTLDMALLDRVRRLDIEFDEDVFVEYAKEMKFYPEIVDFLETGKQYCYVMDPEKDTSEAVTARGWENLSRTMYLYDKLEIQPDLAMVQQFIKSDRVAVAFLDFLALNELGCTKKDIDKMVSGINHESYANKWGELPARALWLLSDYLIRLLSSMCSDKKRAAMMTKSFDNAVEFIDLIQSSVLKEKFFLSISKEQAIVTRLVEEKDEAFIRLCEEFYR